MIFIKTILTNFFPHRWINSNKKGTNRLLDTLAESLSYGESFTELLLRNSYTITAVEILPLLEEEYGIKPSGDISVRRAMIIAKKRTLDCPVTKPDILAMLLSFEITAVIEHFYNEHSIVVSVIENPMFVPMRVILNLLSENIRAHVDFLLETKTSVSFTSYTCSYMQSLGKYNLKMKPADYCVTASVYSGGFVEIFSKQYLETLAN